MVLLKKISLLLILPVYFWVGCNNMNVQQSGDPYADFQSDAECRKELARSEQSVWQLGLKLDKACANNQARLESNWEMFRSLEAGITALQAVEIPPNEKEGYVREASFLRADFDYLQREHELVCDAGNRPSPGSHYTEREKELKSCMDSLVFTGLMIDRRRKGIKRAATLLGGMKEKGRATQKLLHQVEWAGKRYPARRQEDAPAPEKEWKTPFRIEQVVHRGQSYDQFVLERAQIPMLRLFWRDDRNTPFTNIGRLKQYLDGRKQTLYFAVNGGMFQPDSRPEGLFVKDGLTIVNVDKKEGVPGKYLNFYLQPNGIFLIDHKNRAAVIPTYQLPKYQEKLKLATQSGPMLLIDGEVHPAFNEGSSNKFVRNGVGVTRGGDVIFAISNEKVNFYDFALFFRERGCDNALYLDGVISKMYFPRIRDDLDGFLGPIIAVID